MGLFVLPTIIEIDVIYIKLKNKDVILLELNWFTFVE
jgi:hypothetical protein